MNDKNTSSFLISRRQLLRHVLLSSVAAGAASVVIAGCKKPLKCDDTTGLADVDVATRKALAYTDAATDPSKQCFVCAQYVPPGSDDACGGCKMFKGGVNPRGSCTGFTRK